MKVRFYLALLVSLASINAVLASPAPPGWNINARPLNGDYSSGAQNMVWSRDGKWIACQGDEGIAIRDGSTLQVRHFLSREALGWKATDLDRRATPQLLAFIDNRFALVYREPVPDSNQINLRIEWRNVLEGKILTQWKGVKLSDDGRAAYFIGQSKTFRVFHFDAEKWVSIKLPLRITDATPDISQKAFEDSGRISPCRPEIYFSPDGTRAADQVGDGCLRLWNAVTRRKICELKDERGEFVSLPGATGPVVWSPDKKLVATLGEDPKHQDFVFDEGPNDGGQNIHSPAIKIWNAQTGKLIHWWVISEPSRFYWLDKTRVFCAGSYNFEIWNALTGKQIVTSPDDSRFAVRGVQSLSPDKAHLATLARTGKREDEGDIFVTALFNVKNAKIQSPILTQPIMRNIERILWSDNGKFLAVSSHGHTAVWETINNQPQKVATVFPHYSLRMGWTKTGRLWTGSLNSIFLYDARKNWAQVEWKPDKKTAQGFGWNGLFMTPDEKTFLELPGSGGGVLRLDEGQIKPYTWLEPERSDPLRISPQSGGFSESLSPDGRFYGVPQHTSKYLPIFTLYDLKEKDHQIRLEESSHQGEGEARFSTRESNAIYARNGKSLAFGGRIFSLPDGKVLGERRGPFDGNALALSSQGEIVARLSTHDKNPGLHLYEAISGKFLRTVSRDTGAIAAAEFSSDDRVLCVARFGDLEFYDVASGKLLSKAVVLPPPNPAAKAKTARGVTWRVH